MKSLVNINGRIVRPEEALISVFDRGFLFGDGVYETLRTHRGRVLLEDEHMARLRNSAEHLFLEIPGGLDGVREELRKTLLATELDQAYVRLMVTRGATPGHVDLDLSSAGTGSLVIIVSPLAAFDARLYDAGVDLSVVSIRRTGAASLDPAIKSGNYLNNLLALNEARERGAFECLMLSTEGFLTEGATSNVFLVTKGVLRTPALECGLLAGVTRSVVLDVARAAGIEARQEALTRDDLSAADEVFITSTLKDVMPASTIDRRRVGSGGCGPVTRRLQELYKARVRPDDAVKS